MKIADVQKQLKTNEALVLFVDTAERKPTPEETFIWVVTKTASRWARSDLGPKALKDHVDALRCGLDAEGAWKGSRCFDLLGVVHDQWSGKPLPFGLARAHSLYKSLFGKIEDLIKGKDLLIVPSGPLTQLPFQVLITKILEKDELTRDAFTKASLSLCLPYPSISDCHQKGHNGDSLLVAHSLLPAPTPATVSRRARPSLRKPGQKIHTQVPSWEN